MSTEQENIREQRIQAIAETIDDVNGSEMIAVLLVDGPVARMIADAERRGAERGWDEGWRARPNARYVDGGVEPTANPYRSDTEVSKDCHTPNAQEG